MDAAQAAPFIQSITYEATLLEYSDFPRTDRPVNILGTTYSALHELEDIKDDVKSRLWFTYRWGFSPIGGDGPTSDQGWGCMLRCGQMMLAQALINLHLGREWRWNEGKNNPKYYEILRMFVDKKTSCYSIHQIANMGASEGKKIGEWFGPNTIAQVLKKLAMFDDWSNLHVHVALDNTVIIEDIKLMCKCTCKTCDQIPNTHNLMKQEEQLKSLQIGNTSVQNNANAPKVTNSENTYSRNLTNKSKQSGRPNIFDRIQSENLTSVGVQNGLKEQTAKGKLSEVGLGAGSSADSCGCSPVQMCSCSGTALGNEAVDRESSPNHWKPLLLIIPLRLGLSEINPVYINALKNCLALRQSVGIIGGKPNQAHWFIGVVGDELLFLDPHTRQPVEDFNKHSFPDESYHCPYTCRLAVNELDPSVALGFFCRSEADFNDLCMSVQKFVICQDRLPMFEMHGKRPKHWPVFNPVASFNDASPCSSEFECVDRQYDTDEEFELL